MKIKLLSLLIILSVSIQAQFPVKEYAKKEMNRAFDFLKIQNQKPYYIAYTITTSNNTRIDASFGNIANSDESKSRILDIDLRVGDYKFDNTHIIRGQAFEFGSGAGYSQLPIEDDEAAIRNAIWKATDAQFKSAIERYEKALTNKKVKIQEEDNSADLSKEKKTTFTGNFNKQTIDIQKYQRMLERLSNKFSNHPWIYNCNVSFIAENNEKHFINTEGSDLSWGETAARMFVIASTKAEDGMTIPLYLSYFGFTTDKLPKEDIIAKDIDLLIKRLDSLRKAPIMETFTGPALLSGEAAGVFFHEIFGHRVEGHREKDPNSSQTFKKSIDKKIFPDFLSVIFDPTAKNLAGKELSGYYKFDDEGIEGKKVVAVDKGIFKSFLMNRSPIEGFENSNGHGRKQAGYKSVARQSNLIVQSDERISVSNLRKELIKEAKKQNKEYGLSFEVVQGGFTFTSRTIPNAFNVMPLVVYKIFVDGRPDELVRGVDLIGTPLSTFLNITKVGDDYGIFNGVCGAESGGVPVSACSPSLLISTIEVQKKRKSQAKLPILPAPTYGGQ